ncbi:MAG: hypothetical protein R2771_05045 [Saprospiraceae bacterium]
MIFDQTQYQTNILPCNTTIYAKVLPFKNDTSAQYCPEIHFTTEGITGIDILEGNTICFGDSIQLSATGGNTYSWSPANSLTESDIDNPIAFPEETTSLFSRNN